MDSILTDIIILISSALKFFQPVALSLAVSFLLIDIIFTFMNGDVDPFKALIPKTLKWSFFIWLIVEYKGIVLNTIINGAIQLGNYATGSTSTDLLVSPLKFIGEVITVVGTFFGATGIGLSALDFVGIESIPTILGLMLLGIFLTVVLMSLELILVIVEYYLIAVCAILLLPFGLFKKTESFAMRGLSSLFAQSFKILMFTMLLNFLEKKWTQLIGEVHFTFFSLGTTFFSFLVLYMLVKRISAISGALIGGTGVSSTGSSASLAGFAMGAYGKAGGLAKSAYKNAGGLKGMFGGGGGSASGYEEATKGGEEQQNLL